jgi:hypothetical protein
MSTKTMLKGAISTGGHLRAWTGVPVGVAVTYAAGRVMPDFTQIESAWLYGLPYCAPAALLGVGMLFSPKTKNAGYGVLGGTAAYYLWATISNLTDTGANKMPANVTTDPTQANVPVSGAAVQILGGR